MDEAVRAKFELYPVKAREQLIEIRTAIYYVAIDENIGEITESLKWGEPTYTSKKGSPIRIDWKPKNPENISIYFNCQTTLVETFREVYRDIFQYSANREIIFPISLPLPIEELKACISVALRYHNIKHLALLGF